ncbi:MAG: recombination regulator RecX [Prevotellaceae bacterium]|jgi:regulatory protein|nr:recombination regulator RecX [Prevotellaceae bacterium]
MKQITPEQALQRLQKLCSVCEKCAYDVRQKLTEYKIDAAQSAEILQNLQASGFIDDSRFARAFVATKHKIYKWGKQKIEYQLHVKQVSDEIISTALNEIDDEQNNEIIAAELTKKLKTTKAKSQQELVAKLLKFALSRGYDYSVSYDLVMRMVKEKQDEYPCD